MKKLLLSVLVAFFAFFSGNAAKVYFDNSKNWETISTWNFGTEGKTDAAGTVTQVTIDGHDLYVAETEYAKIIFREGDDWGKGQTDNLDVIDGVVYNGNSDKVAMIIDGRYTVVQDYTPTVYFDNSGTGWEKVYAHAWDPPVDEEMSTVEIDGHTLYAYSTKKENILYRSTLAEWVDDKQTANLKVVDGAVYGAKSIISKGGSTDAIANIVDGKYVALGADPYAQIYLRSSRNEFAQSADFKMATTDGKTYTLRVSDADPDCTFKFFVILTDGTSKWFSNGNQEIHNETIRINTDDDTNMSLHMGGDVTFTVKPYNNFEGIELTVAGQEHPEEEVFAPIYLIDGESGWTTKEANKLATTDGITYTITKENLSADYQFKFFGRDTHQHYFSNKLDNLKDDETYSLEASTSKDIRAMSVATGGASVTFTFVLKEDHSSATLTLSGQEEVTEEFPAMYLIGERTNNFSIMEKYRMTTTDGKTYTLNVPDMSTKSFRFCGENTEVRNLGGAGAELADGTYDLVANKHDMTLAKGGDVTFTLFTEDNFATAKLTISGQGKIEPEGFKKMYLIGVDGWNVDNHKNEMTTTDGKTYTIEKYIYAGKEFKFFGGAWKTREFSMKDGLGLEDGTYDVMPVPSENGVDYNLSLKESGNILLTLEVTKDDFSEGKLTIKHTSFELNPEDFPETLYLVGEVNDNDWTPESAIAMTTKSTGIYTLEKANIKGDADNTGLFSFTSKLGSWDDCGVRYGDAAGDGGKMIPGTDGVITGDILVANANAFEVENGIYDITVNLNTLKLTLTPVQGGNDDPVDETNYYLTGEFNGWKVADTDAKFSKQDNGSYILNVEKIIGNIKITNGTWTGNFGGTDEVLEIGKDYICKPDAGMNDNIQLATGIVNAHLVFVPDTKTLTITGEKYQPEVAYVLKGTVKSGDEAEWKDYPMELNEGKWSVTLDTPLSEFGIKEVEKEAYEANPETASQLRWISSADGKEINENNIYSAKKDGSNWKSTVTGKPTYLFDPEAMTLTVSGATGINAIEAEEGDAVYFNLQGQRVANPDKGIYIRVVNGKAAKVVK